MSDAVAMVHVDWVMLLPMLFLLGAACVILLVCALPMRREAAGTAAFGVALLGVAGAFVATTRLFDTVSHMSSLGGMLVMDVPALYMSGIVLGAAFLAILLSRQFLQRAPAPRGEYYALMLLAALGMMIMASTDNLLVMFLGLEVLSVALYVLAGITRDWLRSLEAAMKYFLLGAFSTGFILYGMAFLYGATGSLDLIGIGHEVRVLVQGSGSGGSVLLLVGLGLMIVGLGFKVAAVPFHWWAPDVYEGAPTPVTAFMAVGTKGVAFLALLRLLTVSFGDALVEHWTVVLAVMALASMLLGNLVALTQRNVKRLLAYSSVAHAGYLLAAVAAGSDLGTSAVLFYFASYLVTTLGAFGVVSLVAETGPDGDEGLGMLRYAGLGKSHPTLALAMSVFMISLIGVPPTSGFVGKYFIFQSVVQRALNPATGNPGLFWALAVTGMLLSVVSAAYYLRVIVTMYMQDADGDEPVVRTSPSSGLAVGLATAGVLALGLFPSAIYDLTRNLHSALQSMAIFLAGAIG